ncbi:MAG: histidine kinase [Oscillospiraceae bacterium]
MNEKKRTMYFGVIIFITLVFFGLIASSSLGVEFKIGNSVVNNAKADIKKGSLDNSGRIYLKGEWEFFDYQFIASESGNEREFTENVQIPGFWHVQHRGNFDEGGYGSVRCTLTGLKADESYVVFIPNVRCAYRTYLDGKLLAHRGVISVDSETINSGSRLEIYRQVLSGTPEHELVVEFASKKITGINTTPVIMKYEEAYSYLFKIYLTDIVLSTILLMSSLMLVLFYVAMGNRKISIWLPILVIVVSLRFFLNTTQSVLFQHFFPRAGIEDIGVISVVATFAAKIISALFFRDEMKLNIQPKVMIWFSLYYAGLLLIYVLMPVYIYVTYLNVIFLVASYAINIYMLYQLFHYVKDGKPFALLLTVAYLLTTISFSIESFYYNGYLRSNINSFAPIFVMILIIIFIYISGKQLSEYYQMEIDLAKAQEELAHEQLFLMTNQIRPHFLCNALTAIQCLCRTDPDKAEQSLLEFAGYIRANLNAVSTKEYITFEEELEHIASYVKIEQLRFGEKLEIEYDIEVFDFPVPILAIQTIVENAINHGVSKKLEGGIVSISAKAVKNYYEIVVEDNGVGFDISIPAKETSLGLRNVRKRLETLKGSTMEICSKVNEGTRVTIKIPQNVDKLCLQK